MNSDKTCGPLFEEAAYEAISAFKKEYMLNPYLLFGYGFATGQVEKVYLGAANACMFRPGNHLDLMCLFVNKLIGIYSPEKLFWELFGNEIWVVRKDAEELFREMIAQKVDSKKYHLYRGLLCGVPLDEIDLEFYKRIGYAQP